MTTPREFNLPALQIGRRVLHYDEIDSTSNVAARLAEDAGNHGVAVLARTQTAGRGQQGRSWLCRSDAGVLLSVVVFPPSELRRPALLTAWAAVSVCDLINYVADLESSIKWPNDVLIGGRKVCGILIEQARGVVVGMGLNVQQTQVEFEAAGLPLACSLHSATGRRFDTLEVACRLLHQLDRRYGQLAAGDLLPLESQWRQRLGWLGQEVQVETSTGGFTGRLLELSFDGVLVEGDGEPVLLSPESVRHITAAHH